MKGINNVIGDHLSRQFSSEDWQFNPNLFQIIQVLWGPLQVDRFAINNNRLLSKYNCIIPQVN